MCAQAEHDLAVEKMTLAREKDAWLREKAQIEQVQAREHESVNEVIRFYSAGSCIKTSITNRILKSEYLIKSHRLRCCLSEFLFFYIDSARVEYHKKGE